MKIFGALTVMLILTVLSVQTPALAKSERAGQGSNDQQRYIVVLEDPPLAAYDGRELQTPERGRETMQLQATANRSTGERKLDVRSPRSHAYLDFLDQRHQAIQGEAALKLGRKLQVKRRYRVVLNGFSTNLTAGEASALRNLPGVVSVRPKEVHKLETDSGPTWIGADHIWDGSAGVLAAGGEGIVIGIIDTGINWDHPSFEDQGEGQLPILGYWDHTNPYGTELGLCSEPEVLCNDKLVGVYDFVTDDDTTPELEGNTNGKDDNGHGSHVASIAAGNPVAVTLYDVPAELSGVAPNANIISYRACYSADPNYPEHEDGCDDEAIIEALERAVIDGVDVLNYSIGTEPYNPWLPGTTTYEFLTVRAAGIFAATSAGNFGPNSASMGAPANAPWIMAVGAASHDRIYGSILENLSGGDTPLPSSLVGTSFTNGIGVRSIVHARDYGSALCGVGESPTFPPGYLVGCSDYTGTTNPFEPGTFNGEIVICDRGTYGRIEKGKNLQLAGAGGYVLANSDDPELQNLVPNEHCLPATHIGYEDGELLRNWLASGSGHQASISGYDIYHVPEAGDVLSDTSSRGPNLPPAEQLLKPDVIAPGINITGAYDGDPHDFAEISGTSMSSPSITGAAALLKSVHPDWTPSVLNSVITMTATPELAVDYDGSAATPHKRGAGRPQLDKAVNAGLYLEETHAGFVTANPHAGGDPKNLNLPGLVDMACDNTCDFQRTVTDLVGGATWTAFAEGFANGVVVNVTPSNFTLANGSSRALTISVDVTLAGPDKLGTWLYGGVRLTSDGLPDMVFPVAVVASGGQLPSEWQIDSGSPSGWKEFSLSGLSAMPDATFTSGGLVEPTETTENLPLDPTGDDPYDGGDGVLTVWHTVPEGALWLHTETLPTVARDVDLYVGRDSNADGIAQESEEVCSSTDDFRTPTELCDIFMPLAGDYWVIVQNWPDPDDPNPDESANAEVTLESAVISKDTSSLVATGAGIIDADEGQTVRVSWDNVDAVPGTELLGAVGLGTDRNNANNIGIIPLRYTRAGIEAPETLVLIDGVSRGFALAGSGEHNMAYVDVPPGTDTLTVSATGADETQNNNLSIELYRMEFVDAFDNAPFATAPDTSGAPLASAFGSGGDGPTVVVSVGVTPGRWYAVVQNASGDPASVTLTASMTYTDAPFALKAGLWEPGGVRLGIKQGYDYGSDGGGNRYVLWYTYNEDGTPTWYQAAGAEPAGNVWKARLKRFTNDGTLQQKVVVGWVSLTALSEDDYIYSFTLFGDEGSDKIINPFFPPDCPLVGEAKQSYNGVWSRSNIGVGGATVVVNESSEGYVHYIYDGNGNPVWLQGSANMRQWSGFCPVCTGPTPDKTPAGPFMRSLVDETNMSWTLDYTLLAPLDGTINRTDDTQKITARLECQ